MSLQLFGERAQDLAQVIGLQGYIVTVSEAARALARYRGNFDNAANFILARARRNPTGEVQSRFQQRLGPAGPSDAQMTTVTIGKRPRGEGDTVNRNVPTGEDLKGPVIQIGDKALFTRSSFGTCYAASSNTRTSSYKMLLSSVLKRNLYRWQSIKSWGPNAHETNEPLSLGLECVFEKWGSGDAAQVNNIWLPMYAFDLGSLPAQGPAGTNTKTGHSIETAPMFRLKKNTVSSGAPTYGVNTSLSPTVHNYVWVEQNGLQNGPSADYLNTSDYLWSIERRGAELLPANAVRHDWTSVDMLLKCDRKNHCKVHVALVRFKNHIGPNRHVANNQAWSGTVNIPVSSVDDSSTQTHSLRDVFWESFWAKRLTHPLSDYKNPVHNKYISVLKHKVINVNPEDVGSDRPYMHQIAMFIKDGGWVNLRDPGIQDNVVSGRQGQLPPVVTDIAGAAGTPIGFQYGFGFNQVDDVYDPQTAVCNVTQKGRENNTWLLVYMEQNVPQENYTMINPTSVTRPNVYETNGTCCSFDIRVRKQCSVMQEL